MWGVVHIGVGAHRERAAEPLELELQEAVSHPTWRLRTEHSKSTACS